jgi:hypothetical protein
VRQFSIAGRQVDLNEVFTSLDQAMQRTIAAEVTKALDTDAAREAFAENLWEAVGRFAQPFRMKPESAEFDGTTLRVKLGPQ